MNGLNLGGRRWLNLNLGYLVHGDIGSGGFGAECGRPCHQGRDKGKGAGDTRATGSQSTVKYIRA